MADNSLTASAVVPSANAVIRKATAGATIAAGDIIYLDTADLDSAGIGKAKLSDCNSGTALVRTVEGMAVNSASSGQPVEYVTYDPALVVAASGLTPNQIWILSATAGKTAPSADLTSGWYLTALAVVKTTTTIFFRAPGLVSGVAS